MHVSESCVQSNSGAAIGQRATFPAHLNSATAADSTHGVTCSGPTVIHMFEILELSRYSLQRRTTDFCRLEARLTERNCARFLLEVHRRIAVADLIAAKQLPAIQRLPSPSSPFVFLHIEKTGGTTMRE